MIPREERPLPLLAGLIGWPVAQSKSQLIHEFWLRRLGIDGHYIRLPVRPGEVARAFRGMVALGFAGVQATMPHKRACFDLVDHHTAAAKALGAVNTVIVEDDGSLTGENTDLPGFVEPIASLNLSGEKVTVLGAGGAAAAVIAGLVSLGARRLAVINRSPEGTAQLLSDLAATLENCEVTAAGWDAAEAHATESALIANATSLGMNGMPPMPLGVEDLRSDAVKASLEGIAGNLSSAMTVNYAGCSAVDHDAVNHADKCRKAANCTDAAVLLQGVTANPFTQGGTVFTIQAQALGANGSTDACTVTTPNGGTTVSTTFAGISAGN